MTERLADVEVRIRTVHQLSAVVTAMRGIAAARSREARTRLDGIRAFAQTIADGIGHALAFLPASGREAAWHDGAGIHIIIALSAEQGFAGSFSEHILEAAARLRRTSEFRRSELFLVGDRGLLVASEKAISAEWSAPMIAHPDQAATLANRIVEALYQRLDREQVARVSLLHAVPRTFATAEVVEKQLVPFDFNRFPLPTSAIAPLITLPPQVLLARLVEEYVFAELCEAVMLSFAAENEARMRAMIAAHANIGKTLDGLVARSRQLRQEEITDEIIELASGASVNIGRATGEMRKPRPALDQPATAAGSQ